MKRLDPELACELLAQRDIDLARYADEAFTRLAAPLQPR